MDRIRNAITMNDFGNKGLIARMAPLPEGEAIYLGAIIGRVSEAKEKAGHLPDGSPSISIVLSGEFEANVEGVDDPIVAPAVFLPTAFARLAFNQFTHMPAGSVLKFALKIYAVRTSKQTVYRYDIRSGLARVQDSLADLRRAAAMAGIRMIGHERDATETVVELDPGDVQEIHPAISMPAAGAPEAPALGEDTGPEPSAASGQKNGVGGDGGEPAGYEGEPAGYEGETIDHETGEIIPAKAAKGAGRARRLR